MASSTRLRGEERWPELHYPEWQATGETLHMWSQIVGKIRMEQTPWINHAWNVALYVTARGLTTLPIPHRTRPFQIDFDFIDHQLLIGASSGEVARLELRSRSVADFYKDLRERLRALDLDVPIRAAPNEVVNAIPFAEDEVHRTYEPALANRFFRTLLESARVFQIFRSHFIGKCSPIHFFWGSFDLAVTRFSGRPAPPHPGGVPHLPDWVAREAYSHEVASCGFWTGGGPTPFPLYYAYAYPEPPGFAQVRVREGASYSKELGEFIMPYDRVRQADDPDATLLEFLQATYRAAADLARWDRAALERRESS